MHIQYGRYIFCKKCYILGYQKRQNSAQNKSFLLLHTTTNLFIYNLT
jgi:hypothetical protein